MDQVKDPSPPITKPKQLLVEGRTPYLFFEVLTAHLGIQEVELHDFGSIAQLGPFLRAFCARPEFKEQVQSLAIIRDAEFAHETATQPRMAERAFASVRSHLANAGQPTPNVSGAFSTTIPKTGVFILPNCRDSGMLETLCLDSVLTPRTSKCLEQYFKCMESEGHPPPRNMTKASTFAFLAAKDVPDPLVGRAAQKGIWPWDSPAFQPLRDFLLAL